MDFQRVFVTIRSIFTKYIYQVHKILSSSKQDTSFADKVLKVKPEVK